MKIDLPEVVAEVSKVFSEYQNALVSNDAAVLNKLFWNSPHTLRYGARENLYGYEEIEAFRNSRPAINLEREVLHSVVTTYGIDFANVNIEFHLKSPEVISRQSQTRMRTAAGWRVVAAHVSDMR